MHGGVGVVRTSEKISRLVRSANTGWRALAGKGTATGDVCTDSREQIEHFNREGYIRGIRIFGDAEIIAIREYFDALLAKTIAAGGDSYSISTAHAKSGKVR